MTKAAELYIIILLVLAIQILLLRSSLRAFYKVFAETQA